MCTKITLQNIENLIFENSEIRRKLLNHKTLFYRWTSSRQSNLKSIRQKIIIELLQKLTDEDLKIISKEIGDVNIERINHNVAENYSCTIDKAEELLNVNLIKETFFVYREEESLYLSVWK